MTRFRLLRLGFLFIAFSAHAGAAVISINPLADAFVSAGPAGDTNSQTTKNYGGAGAVGISAASTSKGEFQTLLKFDLSAVVSGFNTQFGVGQWAIDGVSLQLTISSPNNAIFNANNAGSYAVQWMANDSWVEGTGMPNSPTTDGVTFSSLASFLGGSDTGLGTFGFAGGNTGTSTASLTLAPSFTSDLTAGGLVSLRMFAAPSDNAVSLLFNSRSFGTVTSRPLLSVSASAIPEPGGGLLLLSGLTLALGRKRRDASAD